MSEAFFDSFFISSASQKKSEIHQDPEEDFEDDTGPGPDSNTFQTILTRGLQKLSGDAIDNEEFSPEHTDDELEGEKESNEDENLSKDDRHDQIDRSAEIP